MFKYKISINNITPTPSPKITLVCFNSSNEICMLYTMSVL